ncbi:MAG: plasmid replication protein, CyRepA1 family [Crinalium sp.]
MSKFTPTRRGNNCPICGDTSGDCRIVDKIVLCHSSVDSDAGITGWKYLHNDKSGIWGVYVPDTGTNEQGKSWQDVAEERNQRRQREREQQQAKALPVSERNKHYRAIALKLTLSQKHRQHLLEHRGLTQTEIDFAYQQGWIRTWQPGLEVFGISANLAGVSTGRGFSQKLLGVDGISIAACDIEGNIVGHQIATDDREKFAKYIWLSSASKNGSSPHLPNGELPLFVWKHPDTEVISEVRYAEGGVKSLIVALRLWSQGHTDIVVIGAAGGNFAGSPEFLKTVIKQAASRDGLLYPDAGAIANHHIMVQYRKLYELLQKCGYGLNVAWWGQSKKDDQDIDEISADVKVKIIRFIDFDPFAPINDFHVSSEKQSYYCYHCNASGNAIHFLMEIGKQSFTDTVLKLAEKHQIPVAWDIDKPNRVALETIESVKSKTDIVETISEHLTLTQQGKIFQGSCPFHNDDTFKELRKQAGEPSKSEPDSSEYEAYNKKLEEDEKGEEAYQEYKQQQWREQYHDRAKHAWNKAKRFTPTHKINQKYFDFSIPEAGYLTAVKSGLGSGKTEWLRRAVELLPDEGWLALGYRNSLLLQSSERWNFSHLHIHKAFLLIKDPRCKIACCVDSLGHFEPEDFEDKNLILDEVMSIIKHLLNGSTIKERRIQILEKFEEAVRRAKRVFILDGMLADWAVNYIQQLRGDDKVTKIDNEFKREPLNINFYNGTISRHCELRPNDKSPLISRIRRSVEPICICADSQVFCEAIEEILIDAGMEGIRIDGKTISDAKSKDFLKNPDAWIEKNRPDYVILSPTAESGIDISIEDYFKDQYCFFFGVIDVDSMLQFLGRIRDIATQRWIWCAEFGLDDNEGMRSPFPTQVEKALQQFLIEDGLRVIEGVDNSDVLAKLLQDIVEANKSIHHKVFTSLKATGNYERLNLRACLLECLQKAGHNVTEFTGNHNDDAAFRYKEASEEVKQQTSSDIFYAPTIDAEMAENISRNYSATWEDRCKVMKAQLLKRLPGIEASERWFPEFIYKVRYEDRNFINKCQLYWLLTHPEAALLQQRERWNWLVKQEKVFLGDIKSDFSKVWALQQLGILELIESKNVWSDDSPELLALVERGKNKKVVSALGMGVGQSTPTAYLRRVLRLIGVKLKHDRKRKNKKQITLVSIYQPALHDPDRLVILECIDRRLQKYVTGEIPVMDWGLTPTQPNCHTDTLSSSAETLESAETPLNQPQTQSEHDIESVQVFPDVYNKNSKTCTPTNDPMNTPTGTFTPITELPKPTRQEEIEDVVSLLEFCECPVTTLVMLECMTEVPSDLVTDVWAEVPSEKISQMQQWAVDLLVDGDQILNDELFDNGLTITQRVLKALRTLPQKLKSAVWAVVPNWRREELRQWRMEMG